MSLKTRIEKLEDEYGQAWKEAVVCVINYGEKKLPDPEKEIARQRAEGNKIIVVEVPYGNELKDGHSLGTELEKE